MSLWGLAMMKGNIITPLQFHQWSKITSLMFHQLSHQHGTYSFLWGSWMETALWSSPQCMKLPHSPVVFSATKSYRDWISNSVCNGIPSAWSSAQIGLQGKSAYWNIFDAQKKQICSNASEHRSGKLMQICLQSNRGWLNDSNKVRWVLGETQGHWL